MNVIDLQPQRNVNVGKKTPQMVDNLEVGSTASSDISESLREQILGKGYRRSGRRFGPKTGKTSSPLDTSLESAYKVIPSKESFEIIPTQDKQSKEGSYHSTKQESFHSAKQESFHTAQSASGRLSANISLDKHSKEESHHSIRSGSFSGKSQNNVALVPVCSCSQPSMQSDGKRYTTIHTQTVAIQTVAVGPDSDSDCMCCCGDYEYCTECDPSQRHCKCNRRVPCPDESSDDPCTESSSQTVEIKRPNRCTCRCRKNRTDLCSPSVLSLSESDDSYTTDFLDLPYQNHEEYLHLLKELEKKLLARNKERVRRTMMEFEKRSRQNQNLEKPVCHYDSPRTIRKACVKKLKNSICCKCGRNKKVNSDIMQNEKRWDEINYVPPDGPSERDPSSVCHRVERSHRSQWRVDPRTGEWIKVSCFQQTDVCPPPPPPIDDFEKNDCKKLPVVKKECCCCQKKRR